MEDDHAPAGALEAREPTVEDLVELCRHLNDAGAKYVVIGGFAIRAAGYDRRTMDIDLLIDTSLENEPRFMKTGRDKDAPDLHFLRYLFEQSKQDPDAS